MVGMGQDELAQRAQMQALRRAASGTLASSSALKVACVHQQGSLVGWPVSRACSIAHRLGWPHRGQLAALMGRASGRGGSTVVAGMFMGVSGGQGGRRARLAVVLQCQALFRRCHLLCRQVALRQIVSDS